MLGWWGGMGGEKEADPSPAPDTLLVATRRLHGGLVQSEDGRSCPGGGRGLDKRTRAWTAVRETEAGCTEKLEAARRVRHWEACLGEVYGKFLLQDHTLASFPAGHLPGSWTPRCTPAGWGGGLCAHLSLLPLCCIPNPSALLGC